MKTEIKDTKGWYEMHYDAPGDLVDEKASPCNASFAETSLTAGGSQWTNCEGFASFKQIMRGGAHEFTRSMVDKSDRLNAPKTLNQSLTNVRKRQQIFADTGDELDFDEWKRGNVDKAWRTTRPRIVTQKRRKAACLFVNIGTLGVVDANSFEWRGAAAHRIAQVLASNGWSLEIVVGSVTRDIFKDDNRMLALTFTAKPSTMPLSLERLALQTSAAWYRYCVFLSRCSGPAIYSHFGFSNRVILPPYIVRMAERGYKILQVPNSCLSQGAAQSAIDQAIKDVQ